MHRMQQIRRVISGHPVPAHELPIILLSQEFDARYCDLSYEQYLSSPQTIIETQTRCIQEFDYDFAWLHLHDLIEFAPLGVPVKGEGNVVPGAAGHLPATCEMVDALRIPDLRTVGQMPLLLESIRGLREHFGDDVCIMGRGAAPFSSAIFLFGMEQGMVMTIDDPELLQRAIAFFEDYCREVARVQIEAGAHALWIGDCSATSHLISPATLRKYAIGPTRRLLQAIREMGAIAWFYPGDDALDSLTISTETNPDMMNLTYGTDITALRQRVGDRLPLSGNLHPIELIEHGSEEMIRAEIAQVLQDEAGKPFILGSADCVTRATSEKNIRAVIDAVRES